MSEQGATLFAWTAFDQSKSHGMIELTPELPEYGALPIAKGSDRAVRVMIQATAFKDGRTFWVPGMQHANDHHSKLDALNAYRNWLANMIKTGSPIKGEVAIWVEQPTSQSTEQPQ